MSLRLIRFVVIMLAALSLAVGIGHLMELPARMAWDLELAKWVNGPVPGDWADWRQLWEWGQAANGLAQFAGFAALIASVLVMKVKKDKTAKTWG
jgi:hypothetical protein